MPGLASTRKKPPWLNLLKISTIITLLLQLIIFKISIKVSENNMLTKQVYKRPFSDYVPTSPEKRIKSSAALSQFTIKKIIET